MTSSSPGKYSATKFNELYIFGAGGMGREVAWLAKQRLGSNFKLTFVVDKPEYLSAQVNDLQVVLLSDLVPSEKSRFIVALGNSRDRERITKKFLDIGHQPATITHPRAEISPWVDIGEGTVICANCVLTTNVNIGRHVQINMSCTVAHDVIIGDYTTLSPAVNVSGHVHIGRRVFIGTNASIINGSVSRPLIIGDDAIIAAGACVSHDVDARTMVAGVPAVCKRR